MGRKAIILFFTTTALPLAAASAQTLTPVGASVDNADIVVTAQKMSQRAQDVPLVVSAVSGTDLTQAGASSVRDIAATLPGLQVDSTFGVPGVYILTLRGITTGAQQSTTVATYIDDVPVGSSGSYALNGASGLDLLPYDLDHVEVLSGPQGTLYGASSMGGLLKYVTRTPSLNKNSYNFGGDMVGVDQGSKIGWGVRAAASMVMVPGELAISVSGAHQYRPGYIDNVATNQKNVNHGTQDGARAVLYWQPSADFSLKVAGLYNRLNFKGLGVINAAPNGMPINGKYKTAVAYNGGQKTVTKLGSVTADYDFGFAKLTSVTSYSDQNARNAYDATGFLGRFFGVESPITSLVPIKKFTEEVRLASSPENRFHWLAGAFYTREKTAFDQTVSAFVPGTTTPAAVSPLLDGVISSRYRETAVFANATFNITDAWDISGGLRYSKNRQTVVQTVSGALSGSPAVSVTRGRSSDDALTFSASSSYHIAADTMLYARIASGYRPGGPNISIPGVPPSFEPDHLTNYEAGLKSELFDRRLLLNVSGFYIDWRKIQLFGIAPSGLGFLANGGRATSKGVELTTSVKVTSHLTIGGALAYTEAKLKDNVPELSALAGDSLPSTPRWGSSITADYTTSLTDDIQAHVGAVWRYTGPRNQLYPNSAQFHRLGSYSTINGNAGVTRGDVGLNLFVRNLANKYAYTSWYGRNGPVVLQPRTIGLSLDIKLR